MVVMGTKLWSKGLAVAATAVILCGSEYAMATGDLSHDDQSAITFEAGQVGGYLHANRSSLQRLYEERRSAEPKGHGWQAESANNFVDRLLGRDAKVVGGDNALNGADRVITRDGVVSLIQTKYCASC